MQKPVFNNHLANSEMTFNFEKSTCTSCKFFRLTVLTTVHCLIDIFKVFWSFNDVVMINLWFLFWFWLSEKFDFLIYKICQNVLKVIMICWNALLSLKSSRFLLDIYLLNCSNAIAALHAFALYNSYIDAFSNVYDVFFTINLKFWLLSIWRFHRFSKFWCWWFSKSKS